MALLLQVAAILADTQRPRPSPRRPPRRTAPHRAEEPALPAPRGEGPACSARRTRCRRSRGSALTTLEQERRPRIKRLVVGRPKSTGELEETLLPKRLALPIFASDALSSVAYATEAALVVLLAASVDRTLAAPAGVDRDRRPARDRDRLVPADGARLRVLRRRLHRREGQPRHAPEPRRSGGSAHRLRPHGGRLRRRRRRRAGIRGAELEWPPRRSLARVHRPDHDREPARRP